MSKDLPHIDTPYPVHPMDELLQVMACLRAPEGGCPWDREQTFASLIPHTLEEAYEVVETIDQGNFTALRDELGDLLFQVVFYARIAEERGLFDFGGVIAAIVDKLVRRHPHVFADDPGGNPEALSLAWERQKNKERSARGEATASLMDGVGHGLPGLTRAMKLQRRAATVGFDWPNSNAVLEKLAEEAEELRQAQIEGADPQRIMDEVGDLLFTCINLARHHRVDPETALRQVNSRFERRFRHMETLASAHATPLSQLDPDQMNTLWEEVKTEEQFHIRQ
ncbi:Nucleoside triphosphate pyrophosphohydrolase [Gammaproteobacteria bacterium]